MASGAGRRTGGRRSAIAEVEAIGDAEAMGVDGEPLRETGYKWEKSYAEGLVGNIGAVLQESEAGTVEESIRKLVEEAKRARRAKQRLTKVRIGNMRYLYICVDFSAAMLTQEYSPTRVQATMAMVLKFVHKYFEQNPLSQLGIIMIRDKKAEKLCPFTSSPHAIREAISSLNVLAACSGEFSLNAALTLAHRLLRDVAPHASKELLFVMGSLATVDGESLPTMFDILKKDGVKCSVVGLAAEMFVCKKMTSTTGGRYAIALDESHFELLLMDHVDPPPAGRELEASLVRMGFPPRGGVKAPSICMSHSLSEPTTSQQRGQPAWKRECPNKRAFYCPRCGARYCQTPVECRLCSLLLITAPQLARAHQHLEPLDPFAEGDATDESSRCFACSQLIHRQSEKKAYTCGKCASAFCIDCDLLLHESMQICPGCA